MESPEKPSSTSAPPSKPSGLRKRMYWLTAILLSGVSWFSQHRFFGQNTLQQYTLCTAGPNIYTVDKSNPKAECIVVKDGIITAVSDRTTIASASRSLAVKELREGQIIVPGFADAHAHILEYGFKRQLELDGSQSISEVILRIKDYINSHPDVKKNTSAFIGGMGWDQTLWEETSRQFPTAAYLDQDPLLKGRPIVLRRIDGHAAWVSPQVLAEMEPLPKEVEGGQIIRSPEGEATGIFLDNAMALIPSPPWTQSQRDDYFRTAMTDALSVGLTSIHDAFTSPEDIAYFKLKADTRELPIRVYMMGGIKDDQYWGPKLGPKFINYGVDKRLTLRSVKIVGDGALGSWGAALLAPYSDNPSQTGFLLQSESVLKMLVKSFFADGWQVNVHCIGDKANHVILNIFEEVLSNTSYKAEETRPRIEHAQIMTLPDIQRMGDLGVIPSTQPTHATSDMGYAESRLGAERIKGAYAYRSHLESSKTGYFALGSDFPIEGINPLLGFYAAVARLTPAGTSPNGPGGWYTNEALTREQALMGMTLGAAYASFSEDSIGSLEVGKRADFLVLNNDIMTCKISDILRTKVVATIVDGRAAFGTI